MPNAIKLKKKEVPAGLLKAFPNYTGRKFKAEASTKVYVGNSYWDGGTRSYFVGVDLVTMQMANAHQAMGNPGCFGGLGGTIDYIPLTPGRAIVEHVIFCGSDLGLRFHFHPEDFGKLFPMLKEG